MAGNSLRPCAVRRHTTRPLLEGNEGALKLSCRRALKGVAGVDRKTAARPLGRCSAASASAGGDRPGRRNAHPQHNNLNTRNRCGNARIITDLVPSRC